MRRLIQAMLIASSMLLAGLGVWPASAQTTSCQLAPVFVLLRDQIGRDRAGECTGPPIRNEAGDLTQPTTHGILTLRTADQVVAFSDGQTTWLYGPNGLASRPSGGRLAWETGGSSRTGNGTSGTGSTATTSSTPTPTPTIVTPTPTPFMPTPTPFVPTPTPFNPTQTPMADTAPQTGSSNTFPQSVITLPSGAAGSPTLTTAGNTGSGLTTSSPSTTSFNTVADSASPAIPLAAASPTVGVQDELPVSFDGNNAATSKPFNLAGGDYAAHWQATLEHGKEGCYMGTRLRQVDDQNPGALVMHTTLNSTKDHSTAGDTRLFSVAPGRYVLDVATTGCSWKLTLKAP